jgi:hypothetical protein
MTNNHPEQSLLGVSFLRHKTTKWDLSFSFFAVPYISRQPPYHWHTWEDSSLNEVQRLAREAAAHAILRSNSFKKDLKKGFKLAIHEKLPDAPPSPFYLNLRPEGVKNGTLTPADITAIGLSMYHLAEARMCLVPERAVCSIPGAGNPYLDVIMEEVARARNNTELPRRFYLEKLDVAGKRAFKQSDDDPFIWTQAVLFDDLVASAMTKFLAIAPIELRGGNVSDLVVFLNRSSDAKQLLAERGVKLHAVWEFDNFIEWVYGQGHLKRQEFDAIMEYPDTLAAYKRSVNYVN